MDPSPATPGAIFSMLHRDLRRCRDGGGLLGVGHGRWLAADRGGAVARAQATLGDLGPRARRGHRGGLPARERRPRGPVGRHGQRGLPDPAAGAPDRRAAAGGRARLPCTTGATTQDIMDTGLALQLAAALDRLEALIDGARRCACGPGREARRHRDGRPHARPAGRARPRSERSSPSSCGRRRALRADLAAVRPEVCQLVSLYGAAGYVSGLRAARRRGARRDGSAPGAGRARRTAACGARRARGVRCGLRTGGRVCAHGWRGRSSTCRARRSARSARRRATTAAPRRPCPRRPTRSTRRSSLGMAVTRSRDVGLRSTAPWRCSQERSAGEWQIEWHVLPQVSCLAAGALLIAARIVPGLAVHPGADGRQPGRSSRAARWRRRTCSCWRPRWAASGRTTWCTRRPQHPRPRASSWSTPWQRSPAASTAALPIGSIAPADWTGQAVDEATRAVSDWRDGSLRSGAVR